MNSPLWMELQVLEKIGLSKPEIRIYLVLLRLGQSTTSSIVKEAKVPSSKVYEFLDRLIQKGLVSYVIKSNKKHFRASDPKLLKEILNERQQELLDQENEVNRLLPELKSLATQDPNLIHSDIYEGLKGVKSVYERIYSSLKKGETQYIIGAPKIANELIEGYLLDWHQRRIKKGIRCKYIYDSDVLEYGKIRQKMPLTEVRYLPKKMNSPVWIEIFKDHVVICHIKGRNAILFMIHDKEISEGYLDYFDMMWKISTK